MAQTSRERVIRCLTHNHPDRVPREMWLLPWAQHRYPEDIARIEHRFPGDFIGAPSVAAPSSRASGDPYAVGEAIDEWGCRFVNIHAGVHGEVREPLLRDIQDWRSSVQIPTETLPKDRETARDTVNRFCAQSDRFVRAGCCPRPWERLQFLRGTENAMMDIMDADADVRNLLNLIHTYYLTELEFWITTDVDAIFFMDDWGSQTQLLIPPMLWRELFKPLYRDYCTLAHAHGKYVFMHSDGQIAEIVEDLIEVGVDALNSQLFCMDLADLTQRAKGRITFWGEIDRQHVLTAADPHVGRDAVRTVAHHLYSPTGGVIAQFELGPGGNPAIAEAIFEEWDTISREATADQR